MIEGTRLEDRKTEEYQAWKRGVFHDVIDHILDPLKKVMEDGINILCPDGQRRHCFPVVAQYIADYEEQRVLASILSGYCPKCTIPAFKSTEGIHGVEQAGHEPREEFEATRLRNLYKHPRDWATLKHWGYHATLPFTLAYPHADIHSAVAPDLLHQACKCFFDYIHVWVLQVIDLSYGKTKAKGELDARFSRLPPYSALKPFRRGISAMSRWTGKEYKAMARSYLGVIKGLVPDECLLMVKKYLDVVRLSHYTSHDDGTLKFLNDAVDGFWDQLVGLESIFVVNDIVQIGWYCMKLHYLRHYSNEIRQKGSLIHCSTDRTEPWHTPVKDSYSSSNKGPQRDKYIVRDEWRDHSLKVWEEQLPLELRNQLYSTQKNLCPPSPPSSPPSTSVPRITTIVKTVAFVKSATRFSKPSQRKLSILEADLHLPGLTNETQRFIKRVSRRCAGNYPRKRTADEMETNPDVTVFNTITLKYPTVHDPSTSLNERVNCTPEYRYHGDENWIKPRYDTVLLRYAPEREDQPSTMSNRRVARVLCMFQLVEPSGSGVERNVAFVQLFRTNPQPDKCTGMFRVRKLEEFSVVEIVTMERGVHLIPDYGRTMATEVATVRSPMALDVYTDFWLNNHIDPHMYNSIF